MDHIQQSITLKPLEAFFITVIILGGISSAIIFAGVVPHIPIVLAIMFLIGFGLFKKISMRDLEDGLTSGAKSGLGAVFIFFFIGMLISSWMASGTIPTFIYLALEVVNGKFFYAIAFAVSSIIGLSIGSSLTTAATIGVAFMSVSSALGLSEALTAGAVISGAFFGDKMSPLSDTTNLASMIVKVDLFDHIKNMAWTTVPAFLISFVLFAVLSPEEAVSNFSQIGLLKETLVDQGFVHWYSLAPFLILSFLAIKKVSALATLSASILSALFISFFVQKGFSLKEMMNLLFFGFQSDSGVKEVDSLLTRGGMESMMFSISLVLLALSMGGLFFKLGILPALLQGIKDCLNRVPTLIASTAGTAIGINFLLGEQYLSILLTGNAYQKAYEKAGLHPKNLSRALEDAGTVINPLVPWGVCGVFLTGVLGVDTISYLPFTFFCLLSPLLTVFYGITGFTIAKK
ncbi:Na+/H+ antiporter NhaC [Bacillus sp. DTU_2020_1000418_1_SI_GHA_SEK_038]|uniref:Na+/H+ antiporter NhaC n=1 Tax=Bacillus sp. DTU_2020_1000418_1_SI_GHA_SEK_038 TaxID=3077585 RepID=UPI0028E8AC95|nr:Na+/H+ antiporter NhaC [Bacillus sp. DTU_2020_1000418_1_SI_GHA_SEK_038]WNS76936.1 Na+/H+ antiporter NhaC [Bacillus sp. DTU_2020_1000418_1_SI_GHA_SEK_038]